MMKLIGFKRLLIEGDDRVQLGALAVVSFDAREIHLHELLGGERACVEGRVDLGDRGFIDVDLRGPRGAAKARDKRDDQSKFGHVGSPDTLVMAPMPACSRARGGAWSLVRSCRRV